jgi:hypothetical protein
MSPNAQCPYHSSVSSKSQTPHVTQLRPYLPSECKGTGHTLYLSIIFVLQAECCMFYVTLYEETFSDIMEGQGLERYPKGCCFVTRKVFHKLRSHVSYEPCLTM